MRSRAHHAGAVVSLLARVDEGKEAVGGGNGIGVGDATSVQARSNKTINGTSQETRFTIFAPILKIQLFQSCQQRTDIFAEGHKILLSQIGGIDPLGFFRFGIVESPIRR